MWLNSQVFGISPSLKQTLHSSRAAARISACVKGVKWKIEHPLQSWNRSSKTSHASACCDNTEANAVLILDPLQLLLMLDTFSGLSPIPAATCWLLVCNLSLGHCCVIYWSATCSSVFPQLVTWGAGGNQQKLWPPPRPRKVHSGDKLQEMHLKCWRFEINCNRCNQNKSNWIVLWMCLVYAV